MILLIILTIIIAVIFTTSMIIWAIKARQRQAPTIAGVKFGASVGLVVFTSTIVPPIIVGLALSVFTADVLWITDAQYWEVKIFMAYTFFVLITMLVAIVCSVFIYLSLREIIGRQYPKLRIYNKKH